MAVQRVLPDRKQYGISPKVTPRTPTDQRRRHVILASFDDQNSVTDSVILRRTLSCFGFSFPYVSRRVGGRFSRSSRGYALGAHTLPRPTRFVPLSALFHLYK